MMAPVTIPWTRLPFSFDPALLRRDLGVIPDAAWVPHFNGNDYSGQWSSIALRSRTGCSDDIVPRGTPADFTDTPLAAQCPAMMSVVQTFDFPKKSVRLLRLRPGSKVREHRDADLGLADGEIRIHVPILTNDRVEFIVANRRLMLRPGEAWYIDFSQAHRIDNEGDTDRIHLVIDGRANDWVLSLIRRAATEVSSETYEPDRVRSFRDFRDAVFEDPQLQAELLKIEDRQALFEAVVALGAARGHRFTLAEVQSAYEERRRAWSDRSRQL